MDAVLAVESKAALTEPALRKIYEDATKQMSGQPEDVHVRMTGMHLRTHPLR